MKCGAVVDSPHPSESSSSSDSTGSNDDGYGDSYRHRRYGRNDGRRSEHNRRRSRAYRDRHDGREKQGPRNKGGWIKPEKFNGHGSFETFLVQFENCASYNRWSRSDKVAHLRWSLTGTTAQLLWSSGGFSYGVP